MIKIPLQPYYPKLQEYFDRYVQQLSEEQHHRQMYSGNRNYGENKKFEDWLFLEGIILVREHKKMYLQFLNEQQAIMFALKWGAHD